MRSKVQRRAGNKVGTLRLHAMLVFISLCWSGLSLAGIHDRVVAFVDNQAITLSELQQQYEKTREVSPGIRKDEVLNTMINRLLLLREAKKYRLEAVSRDEVIREYIDLKIRAYIRIPETELEEFYRKNAASFEGKDFEQARDEIERYLTEKELLDRLTETVKELRKGAYIKVQLEPE